MERQPAYEKLTCPFSFEISVLLYRFEEITTNLLAEGVSEGKRRPGAACGEGGGAQGDVNSA